MPRFSDLSPAVELETTFQRCHNYIYANQGLQKAEAFHEMLKLIFCKVYDETESAGELRVYIRTEERRSEAGQRRVMTERIAPLFEAVKGRYPYIFKENEEIALNRRVLAYIVSELQRISLLRSKTDIKGAAYEVLVGANLRGDRGEFFTPRNVCDMAVHMAISLFPSRRMTTLKILDCCCGTGGFLVSAINFLRATIAENESTKGGSEDEIQGRAAARVKNSRTKSLWHGHQSILGADDANEPRNALYRQVLGPIEEIISQKKRLSFVFDGALTSLPPQVLIISDPNGKDFASLDWLIRKYAVTVLPSIASLKILREEKSTVAAIKPMIGFGDPVFDRTTETPGRQHVSALNERSRLLQVRPFYNRRGQTDARQ